jgi:creatinine amidohydrolase
MSARAWAELTTTDVAALDKTRAIAVLPLAAIEQHGPHLPLGTDALINAGILGHAAALTPADLDVLLLPALAIGKSNEHLDFPGTLSLSAETLIRTVAEIGESLARTGVRKLVLFNSHGGQPQVADIVAQDLRARHAMMVVAANSWRMMKSETLVPAAERASGLHAGAIETALMLHLHPELVRRDHIAAFPSAAAELGDDFPALASGGRLNFAWQAQDLNPTGAVGDARLGTAEMGRALVENGARALVELMAELARLPLSVLRAQPGT